MNDDTRRELEKVAEAIGLASAYHQKINEANSKLHSSDKVMYSPLTTKLMLAEQSLERIINQ